MSDAPPPVLPALPGDAAHRPGAVLWSVQYLRAAAAVGVIAFHALSDTGHDFVFGAVGIHLFFTISGFLMWTTTCDRPANIAHFVRGRVSRIVPHYWIATAATLALSTQFPGFFYQATLDPRHILKSLLFIPQTGSEGGLFPVLYQGWTLQYEMFFYALFALALAAPVRLRLGLLAAVLGPLALIGIVHGVSHSPAIATYTDPICLEFLLGAGAGWVCANRTITPRLGALLLAGGAAALLLAYPALGAIRAIGWLAIGGSAAAILTGAVTLERAGAMPQWRWLKYTGEASYSLYLFQEMGFLAASLLADAWPPAAVPLVKAALGTIAALIVGLGVYAVIERPLQRLLRPRRR